MSSHPAFEPHLIQAWTPDFIPSVLQETIDKNFYDQILPVSRSFGIEWSQKLAKKEVIFTGISGGSTFAIAMEIAATAEKGSVILCVLPDTGERYLSSPLFNGITEDMGEEELALSFFIPGYQLDMS